MSVVFINNSSDTFTSTQSGAIATFIWECCRAGAQQSIEPVVISRRAPAEAYNWSKTILIDYPYVPKGFLGVILCRLERKLDGWRNLRQRAYAAKVADALLQTDL